MIMINPNPAVRNPRIVNRLTNTAQTSIAGLFLKTALMLEITAVMTSTSRLAIIGRENTLAAKLTPANTEPTAVPMSRKVSSRDISS